MGDEKERRAHYFFHQCAAREMSDEFDESFWRLFISRVGQSHPAVYHMANAVGAAYEAQKKSKSWLDECNVEKDFAFARSQCNKAIQDLRSRPIRSSHTLHLLCSLLCWQYNTLTDRGRGASHVAFSVRMIQEMKSDRSMMEERLSVMERNLITNHIEPFVLHAGGCIAGASKYAPTLGAPFQPRHIQNRYTSGSNKASVADMISFAPLSGCCPLLP